MLIKTPSIHLVGIDARGTDIEVNVLDRAMPRFEIIGLASREVVESKERVTQALVNTFGAFPYGKRITINLTPADVPKEGVYYDLPIACALSTLFTKGVGFHEMGFFGELSLTGEVRKVKGAFAFTDFLKNHTKVNYVIVPKECFEESYLVNGIKICPISTLADLVPVFNGEISLTDFHRKSLKDYEREGRKYPRLKLKTPNLSSFADVAGQYLAKRALQVSAVGCHNIYMIGSPGSGKSMLARLYPSLLPSLSREEALEVARVYSGYGEFDTQLITSSVRPFRSPHHTVSYSGMVGGGAKPRPGEITLAHHGVLFLDELLEFSQSILNSLRQPLEDFSITISRAKATVKMPCDFTLLCASNPCPCGYYEDPTQNCSCTALQIKNYRNKLSGPFLDRIDMAVKVFTSARERESVMSGLVGGNSSSELDPGSEVFNALSFQLYRMGIKKPYEGGYPVKNSRLTNAQTREMCKMSPEAEVLLNQLQLKVGLSVRGVFRTVRLARSIADLAQSNLIERAHLAEAFQLKSIS